MTTNEDNQTKDNLLANLRERKQKVEDGRKGTFCEIGMFGTNKGTAFGMDKIQVPADGVITGYGKIDGRKVYVYAQDFTSIGGTL